MRNAILVITLGLVLLFGCISTSTPSNTCPQTTCPNEATMQEMIEINAPVTNAMVELNLTDTIYGRGKYCMGFSYECDDTSANIVLGIPPKCKLPDGINYIRWELMPYVFATNPEYTIVTLKNHSYYTALDEPSYQCGHEITIETNCKGKLFRYGICGKDPQVATENEKIMTSLAKIC